MNKNILKPKRIYGIMDIKGDNEKKKAEQYLRDQTNFFLEQNKRLQKLLTKKLAILQVATNLFKENGILGTSFENIAEGVNTTTNFKVTRQLLLTFFKSKKGLIQSVIDSKLMDDTEDTVKHLTNLELEVILHKRGLDLGSNRNTVNKRGQKL